MAAEFQGLAHADADTEALQSLLESNPGYTQRISGRDPGPGDARIILTTLPPETGPDSKYCWGMWEDGRLVAFADVIRGYPQPAVAHIGLLISSGGSQRQGLGRRMHDYVVDRVSQWAEITVLRLGIVETNAGVAAPFWRSCGYAETGEVKSYTDGEVHSVVAVWERPVTTSGTRSSST